MNWYVLHTKPRNEKKVEEQLCRWELMPIALHVLKLNFGVIVKKELICLYYLNGLG